MMQPHRTRFPLAPALIAFSVLAASLPAPAAPPEEILTLRLEAESGAAGWGHPYPTAVADPIQCIASITAFPPLISPRTHTEWSGSQDSRLWTVRFAGDLFWGGDEDPVRPEDFIHSLEGLLAQPTRSPYAILFRHILGLTEFRNGSAAQISGLVTLDPVTLQILLRESDPEFPQRFQHPAAGLIHWGRRHPHHPPSGPIYWDPQFGRPHPSGLNPVRWIFNIAPVQKVIPTTLESMTPFPIRLECYPEPVVDTDEPGPRLVLTGPDLPAYCIPGVAQGVTVAESRSLLLLIAQPEGEGTWGLTQAIREKIFQGLAGPATLLPHAEGIWNAEGILENPEGYRSSLLQRLWKSQTIATETKRPIRLFYPSGDPILSCAAARIPILAAEAGRYQIMGMPRTALHSSLRQGTFDLILMAVPVMAAIPWEAAGITVGFLEPHLNDAILGKLEGALFEDWLALPADPIPAETQARRLEKRLMENAVVFPLAWMTTRLMIRGGDSARDSNSDPNKDPGKDPNDIKRRIVELVRPLELLLHKP
ncbi:MAG: hypothetical protein KJ970_00835 [Candidatus Eisenbacteria bacterium]|uniref:Solute-binding protein family 5 domain-containing protein n=1 Tax=Eiseniibacteriota bacterium TaxID=2212470 RepID=A0A948RSZ4_UNCEI|nr:hypothetical protein [Candidatus Eisenbacteria bacterium]MBU1949020.1 hypothetical protein [Candidatus Eisenbacteria bacterium]MBU2689446.1 hypothetical protein [Candidatus Eisenbacteria bacterium]